MKVKKLRKVLSKGFSYKVGINGDYVGVYMREDLREFDDLKVESIWTTGNGNICLDLVTKRK